MLELIMSPDNLNAAFAKVSRNKGARGIDNMTTRQLFSFLRTHGEQLRYSVLSGTYSPQPLRYVQIPKPDGGTRTLGIPTATDRLIQRAIVQVLMPLYEPAFSDNSFGYRPARNIQDAVARCLDYLNAGYVWAADMDIEKFFDSVDRGRLLQILSRDIRDERLISLIADCINSPLLKDGRLIRTSTGIPQGGPLSPFLANIMLNELDCELIRRGENFVRYADDMLIFCRSEASAWQALKHILPFLEGDLTLRINEAKTLITHAGRMKFLGYRFRCVSGGWMGYNTRIP
ncbi:MAG: group II intron reverse transcriptase/maturase [Synergistaceae bacterium]|nr:group II intron reverse transcriptase/maturase [Synergistaceae bacterium]